MLEVKNLYSGYNGREILHNVSFEVNEGHITAILGPNGCGKSTLIKSLCGILHPSAGHVILDGEDLLGLPQNLMARKTAYLAQNKAVSDITAGRLILHGRFPYLSYPRRYREEDENRVMEVMEQMDISELYDIPISRLSGGQQQKVFIAMAVVQDTDVILLDEPMAYLDISCQMHTLRQARRLAVSGKHVIMVIHDVACALERADRIILMEEGRVRMQGTPEEIYRIGALDAVFSVKVSRVSIEKRWHYFCTE